jgi:hypothetical protein
MHRLLQYLGIEDKDIECRYQQRLYTAVYTTLSHWVLLKNARKNEIKVIRKRLPLMQIEDGYPLQYCHLATEYCESPSTVTHHNAVGSKGDT